MISSNELRFCNWVQTKKGKKIQVVSIVFDGINIDGGDIYPKYFSEDIDSISLTPEILERCGFKKGQYIYQDGSSAEAFMSSGRRYVIRKINIGGNHPEYWGVSYFPYPQSQNSIPAELNYLHQLQNLFFALPGQELEVKL